MGWTLEYVFQVQHFLCSGISFGRLTADLTEVKSNEKTHHTRHNEAEPEKVELCNMLAERAPLVRVEVEKEEE